MNGIFVGLILVSVSVAALAGTMDAVAEAAVESAVDAAKLALGLLGQMALWLGRLFWFGPRPCRSACAVGMPVGRPVRRRRRHGSDPRVLRMMKLGAGRGPAVA